jgi:hypothetical protein
MYLMSQTTEIVKLSEPYEFLNEVFTSQWFLLRTFDQTESADDDTQSEDNHQQATRNNHSYTLQELFKLNFLYLSAGARVLDIARLTVRHVIKQMSQIDYINL